MTTCKLKTFKNLHARSTTRKEYISHALTIISRWSFTVLTSESPRFGFDFSGKCWNVYLWVGLGELETTGRLFLFLRIFNFQARFSVSATRYPQKAFPYLMYSLQHATNVIRYYFTEERQKMRRYGNRMMSTYEINGRGKSDTDIWYLVEKWYSKIRIPWPNFSLKVLVRKITIEINMEGNTAVKHTLGEEKNHMSTFKRHYAVWKRLKSFVRLWRVKKTVFGNLAFSLFNRLTFHILIIIKVKMSLVESPVFELGMWQLYARN